MAFNSQDQQSQFNDSMGSLGRLNKTLMDCGENTACMDTYRWFLSLNRAYTELSSWIAPADRPGYRLEFEEIAEIFNEIKIKITDNPANAILAQSTALFFRLQDLEIRLRDVAFDHGLLFKQKEDLDFTEF